MNGYVRLTLSRPSFVRAYSEETVPYMVAANPVNYGKRSFSVYVCHMYGLHVL